MLKRELFQRYFLIVGRIDMMVKIDDAKLENIKGGGYGWIGALIAAVAIFVSGVFEGNTHPKKCSDEQNK